MKLKPYLTYCSLLLIFSCSTTKTIQETEAPFPTSWLGVWEGDLFIHNNQGLQSQLPMQLKILPLKDSTFTYTIVYGEDTPENSRPYLLKTLDQKRGHFLVDEQNSILLNEYFIHNKLYSRFEVSGHLLLATVEKRGEELIYEIISGPLQPIQTTGDTIHEGEEIPPVNSYEIVVQQRAVLRRAQ